MHHEQLSREAATPSQRGSPGAVGRRQPWTSGRGSKEAACGLVWQCGHFTHLASIFHRLVEAGGRGRGGWAAHGVKWMLEGVQLLLYVSWTSIACWLPLIGK